ncbi:hypothetical protein HRG_002848 [Hirsutella rhossiliensis]|uniref:CENP-V/GFA domain-containing protein n=1 Tax=Hirsutella rhossiliensis TaxID=111463 RepID=A0A9P8N0U3_9HYPO|nr:uncharacterized protein HRG_02848 [Hirsutella rhossiliensis]KAH0964832.1 hypothetical protein HRG_02848 [Hirsutella rhossiliensis]
MSEPNFADLLASPENPDNVWYPCSCHCGATSFKILHEPLESSAPKPAPVLKCNCSICVKNGYLLIYAFRDQIEYTHGWDALRNYRFASKTWDHKFCGVCGTSVGIDFLGIHPAGNIIAINGVLAENVHELAELSEEAARKIYRLNQVVSMLVDECDKRFVK